jgi:hypothetical protein
MSENSHRLLRRLEAAKHVREKHNIPCEPSSLRTLAHKGMGPPFKKVGRFPLYDPHDIDAWVLAKSSPKVRSTSELTALRATCDHVSR